VQYSKYNNTFGNGIRLNPNFFLTILLFYNNLSECQYVDEINYLLDAFRWQKKFGNDANKIYYVPLKCKNDVEPFHDRELERP
jgi:hypothetical protein